MTSSRDEDSADAPDLASKRPTDSQPAHDRSLNAEPELGDSRAGDAPSLGTAHVATSTRHTLTGGATSLTRGTGHPPNPEAHEVASLSRWLADFDEALPRAPLPTTTPLIVTPLGLPDRVELQVSLRALGIVPLEVRLLGAWARCSTALQVTRRSLEALRCAVAFEHVWTALAPDGLAEVWELSLASARIVAQHKPTLRARLRNLELDADGALPRRVRLHAFHLADEDDFLAAGRRLTVGALLASRYG